MFLCVWAGCMQGANVEVNKEVNEAKVDNIIIGVDKDR